MTPKQADRIIKMANPVTVHSVEYNETFTRIFIRRDRWSIYSSDGNIFDRQDLDIVQKAGKEQSR